MEMYHRIPVKHALLFEFAKTTFRGYCTRYQAQTNEVKQKMELANHKEARHRSRRLDVCCSLGFLTSTNVD